jgi:ABC-2 type transport system permease protein
MQMSFPEAGPNYWKVFLTFARNSLIRDMTFRANFIFQCISSVSWTAMNVGFYLIIFQFTKTIGEDTGWHRHEFFLFLATTWFINSIVQAFFMSNAEEFSELIRTGGLDFALLKPIDTQFLISFRRIEWSSLSNFVAGLFIAGYSLYGMATREIDPFVPTIAMAVLYVFFVLFVIPVLVVVNVPARVLAMPLHPRASWEVPLMIWAVIATIGSIAFSRWLFRKSLLSYRSASS